MGDKERTSAQGTQSGEQGGDKCKLMRPKAPRVGDKAETSVNSCGPRHQRSGRQKGDKCKLMRHKTPRVGDKGETSVNSCGPSHPEWETRGRQVLIHAAQGTQSGKQGGGKCKPMRPKAPRVGDKGETSVNSCGPTNPEGDKGETSVNSCGPKNPQWETSVGDKWETSVNSCGPRNPEWETSVGDNCKVMQPKAPRVRDKCGRQGGNKGATGGRQV